MRGYKKTVYNIIIHDNFTLKYKHTSITKGYVAMKKYVFAGADAKAQLKEKTPKGSLEIKEIKGEIFWDSLDETIMIMGKTNSEAYNYAVKHNITFIEE